MNFKCRQCLLPSLVPGSDIDQTGRCRKCREYVPGRSAIAPDPVHRKDLEETLTALRRHSGSNYHCLVPFSGGKDSLYLLYRLKVDYGLKVLAYTSQINLPGVALDNIRTTLETLQVDHLVLKLSSSFYEKLFRYLLKNQERRGAVYTISYVYAALFESESIQLAIEKSIPLIFAGYSPGQPDPQRMKYEFSRKAIREDDWTPPQLKNCGEFAPEELSRFYNASKMPQGTRFPRYIAPFHAWDYDQDQIMKKVFNLGLVSRKANANPILSNFPIHWLLIYSDLRHFGYNSYIPEFSDLIREGKSSRSYWQIAVPVLDFMIKHRIFIGQEVTRSLKWLDLSENELAITLPEGAYDPPFVKS